MIDFSVSDCYKVVAIIVVTVLLDLVWLIERYDRHSHPCRNLLSFIIEYIIYAFIIGFGAGYEYLRSRLLMFVVFAVFVVNTYVLFDRLGILDERVKTCSEYLKSLDEDG